MPDHDRNAVILAVTGGIACGKSEVGRILGQMDFEVCDADRIAHGLMARGTPVYRRVVEEFGSGILYQDGEINRALLGGIVFGDPEKRLVLNRLVHPAVRVSMENWIAACRLECKPGAALIPLLFESGMEILDWDAIVCVSSSEDRMVERLAQRGVEYDEALRRIHSQMELPEKERRSDRVIRNDGSLQKLEQLTKETVASLLLER